MSLRPIPFATCRRCGPVWPLLRWIQLIRGWILRIECFCGLGIGWGHDPRWHQVAPARRGEGRP